MTTGFNFVIRAYSDGYFYIHLNGNDYALERKPPVSWDLKHMGCAFPSDMPKGELQPWVGRFNVKWPTALERALRLIRKHQDGN